MSHSVESMAYTNEVPWHGLGQYIAEAPNVPDMLKVAGIDWRVNLNTMYHEVNGEFDEVDGFRALTRDRDNKVLDVVGRMYVPIQNEQAFEFFYDFVEAGDATMETAGSLQGGKYVWGLAKLNKSFKLGKNDEVKSFVLVACPHQQGKSMIIKWTSVRVVCQNTLSLALGTTLDKYGRSHSRMRGAGELRIHHRTEFGADAIQRAKVALGIAREQTDSFEENARALKKKTMVTEDVRAQLAQVFQPGWDKDEETLNPTMQRLMDIHVNAPGADPSTAWGVLNTVTYFSDHIASRTADKRLTNAWFGSTARKKELVFSNLLAA